MTGNQFFHFMYRYTFITLTLIIAYLIYKVDKIEESEKNDYEYEMFKEFGNDQSHAGQGFEVDET